uniref:Kunitz/BPTI-like toxin n=1 Tax=Pogona vitticeps TaxID=103695 RepID=A0ABM5G4V9_9SAUR
MKSGSLLLLAGLLTFWALLTVISGQPEICHLLPDPGPCRGAIVRYFYNTKTKKCEEFIYGGCHGNKNNFETLKDCHYTCEEKPGTCPKPPKDIVTTCDAKCKNDWKCPGKKKCCHYGCRIACYDPVK